ncbi:MAG: undecaprenyl-diphosphate phosphatase [Acidobacteriota bacterium]
MTWWQALLLGIVEGVTEYLPVSSTGHLILTSWMLGLAEDDELWSAVFTFEIVIQAGAIAAVFGLYRQRVGSLIRGVLGRDEQGRHLALCLVIAFFPAAVFGLLLRDLIEDHLHGPYPVILALAVGGIAMVILWRRPTFQRNSQKGQPLVQLTLSAALLIGLAQCLALWPGTSRSMVTLVAAIALGLCSRDAAEFSFLLGGITLSAATAYQAYQGGGDMLQQIGWLPLVIGFVSATVSAALAVRWFVEFLVRRGLEPFGWYRVAIAALMLAVLQLG